MRTKLKKLARFILLLPVFPLFWWGPVTHPYINRMALKKAKDELEKGNTEINKDMLDRIETNEDVFVFAGNSADAITTHHILNNISIYDYAHNALPNDDYKSTPEFGYTLIDEWIQTEKEEVNGRCYSNKDFVIACGWLAHQLADWYPHYAAIDRNGDLVNNGYHMADEIQVFSGFSDSHFIFGADYYPEILQSYVVADHALTEFLFDLIVLHNDKSFIDNNRVELFENYYLNGNIINLLSKASERYYNKAVRIPPEHIPVLKETFNTVIKGLQILFELITFIRPSVVDTVKNSIDPQINGKTDYLSLSIDKVVNGLFKKSYKEISALSKKKTDNEESSNKELSISLIKKPGTIFFPLVREIGNMIDFDEIMPLFRRGKSFPIYFGFLGLNIFKIDIPNKLISYFASFINTQFMNYISKNDHNFNATLSFLGELLRKKHPDISLPLQKFKQNLRPVVRIDGPLSSSQEDLLKKMFIENTIQIKIVPATSLDNPLKSKLLNPEMLLFRIDGYNVKDHPEYFELFEKWESNILKLSCKIKKQLQPGTHHIFVDIHDNTNVHASYLDQEIILE